MGKKIEIENIVIEQIIIDSKLLSIRKLSAKYSLNKNTIIRILNENNKESMNNVEYLVCKKTNQLLYDVNNKSGLLSKHLKLVYNENIKNIDYSKYFNIKYSNPNSVGLFNYIKSLRVVFNKKDFISGITKYYFKTKNMYVFFIENNIIASNKKIKPIFLYKLKDRYKNSIFIYEDEWESSADIVRMKLKTLLNINKSPKIFGRKCTILSIDEKQKNMFLNKYHIQKACNSTINYGAFYNNELVAVMTFTTHRNMTNDLVKFDYELNRYATNTNYLVIGIGGKILKTFLKTLNGHGIIVSYGDRRWVKTHKKNLYTQLGFNLNQISKHDYSYIKPNTINRIHKITIQQQIKNKKINENEILDYKKIWDCGKYRYTYKY